MIKVVHIAKPLAGVGIYIKLLSEYLDPMKFEIYILCNKYDDNIEIYNANNTKIEFRHISINREIDFFSDYKCFREILTHLKKIKPNIIHCHSAKAGILGRIAAFYLDIPCLYTPHALSYLSAENSIKKSFFKFVEKSFKFLPSKILACSNSEYDRICNDLSFPLDKVLLWKNSIDTDNELCLPKVKLGLPTNYICTIGRPSYQKNTELLIKTIFEVKKEFDSVHLVVLGVGLFSPAIDRINNLIHEFNLSENISLVEWLPRKETLSVLKNSLFYVSASRYEGLSYAALEALLFSKPLILTNVDGNKDLVEPEINGFLVEENSNIFASKIIKLLSDKILVSKMSKESRKKLDREFDMSKNIEKLENIYNIHSN